MEKWSWRLSFKPVYPLEQRLIQSFHFHEFIEVLNERRDPFFALPVEAADAILSKDEKYGKFLGHDSESRDSRHVPEFRALFI
jgi:hypothetical protein